MFRRISEKDERRFERLREHYEIEKELADKLRVANREERLRLYTTLYDELYRRVPDHPQLTRKSDPNARTEAAKQQLPFLTPFLKPESTFCEIGPGDCSLAFEVAKSMKKVYAVDVSDEITSVKKRPENVELFISDGISIPVPENSVNVAYSNALIEHIHPDDINEHLRNVYRALVPGGIYTGYTPNRLCGPRDVSKYFDEEATGFHLKEYLTTELQTAFKAARFSKVRLVIFVKGFFLLLPVFPARLLEEALGILPRSYNKRIANWSISQLLLGVRFVAMK